MLQRSCGISLEKEVKKGCCRPRLRASVFIVISSLSLPLCCGHMPVWYQHMVGNTLLPMRLFICVPVYLSSLSLRREPPPPPPLTVLCSLSPSVVRSILSIYLPVSASFWCLCSSNREGTSQHAFLYTCVLTRASDTFLLTVIKDVTFRKWGILFQEAWSGPEGSPCSEGGY